MRDIPTTTAKFCNFLRVTFDSAIELRNDRVTWLPAMDT